MSGISVSGFDSGSDSVIDTDPKNFSGDVEPIWFDRLTMSNVTLAENKGQYIANMKQAANIATISHLTLKDNTAANSIFYLDLAGGTVNGLKATSNTAGNYVTSFGYFSYLPSSASDSDQSKTFILTNSSFEGNTITKTSSSGVLSVTGFETALVQNVAFENNKGGHSNSFFSGNGSLIVQDTTFTHNSSQRGALTLQTVENATTKTTFHNISATGNEATGSARYGKVLTVYSQYEDYGASADIILSNDRTIEWTNSASDDSETSSAIGIVFGSQNRTVNLEVQTNADFSTDLGIHAAKYSSSMKSPGLLKVTKTGSAVWTLGGESHFEVDTLFDVSAGTLALMDDARLIWYQRDDTESRDRSLFELRSNSSLDVGLYDVTEADPANHGSLAPISLADNRLLLDEGSSLKVRIRNADEARAHAGQSSWLILAENAELDDKGAAVDFAPMENWIFSFDEEAGSGIQQGITDEGGNIVEGTEKNVYIGYTLQSTITPDEAASTIASATSHFAFSSLETISDGLFFWRPDRSDSLWVRPTYIHDRRTPDNTVGFDANLRGFTAGKDFRTENGFWGAALGYGIGSLHSLGASAYTSGDVRSGWAALYGEHQRNELVFRGLVAYLHQNADQDQLNDAAELHTDTTNDVILARLSAAYEFTLSEKADAKTTLSPEIGLQYAWLKQHDFDVKLQGGTELLHGDEESMSIFSIPVKGTLRHDWAGDGSTRHNVAFSLGGEVTVSDLDMDGRFKDFRGRDAGKWSLVALDRWQAEAQLAYTLYDPENAMTLTLGGGYIYGENREQTEAHAVIRWLW